MLTGSRYARRELISFLLFGLLSSLSSSWAHETTTEANPEVKAGSVDATKAYVAAAEAQNRGDFAEAAERWSAFVNEFASDPLVARVQHYLGVCRLHTTDLSGAENAFMKSLAAPIVADDSEFREETYIDLGWVHFLRGAEGDTVQMEKAAEYFGKYLKNYPKGTWLDEALFYRGESLVFTGKEKEGIDLHVRVVEEFPKSPLRVESLFAVGAGLFDLGQRAESAKYFDEFIRNHKDDKLLSDVAFRRGQLYIEEKKFNNAAHMFGVAVNDTDFAARDQALFQRGYSLSAGRNYSAAAKSYTAVARHFPNSGLAEQATLDAGRCHFHADEMEESVAWLNKAIQSESKDRMLQARHWLSRGELKATRFDSAAKEAKVGLDWIEANTQETHRMHLPLLLDYAESLEGIPDQRDGALSAFVELVDTYPKSSVAPRALYRAVRLSATMKDKPRVESLSQRFNAEYEDHELTTEVKKISAEFALSQGAPEEAESQLRDLMAEKEQQSDSDETPELPAPPESSTSPEPKMDADDSATPAAPTLLPAQDPESLELPESPESPLDDATATVGPNLRIALKLGHALFLQEKYAECIAELKEASFPAASNEHRAERLQLIGTSHFHLAEYEEAIKSLSAAVLADPRGANAPEICVRLAQSFVKVNRPDDARTVLARVVTDFPQSELREQCLFQLGELEYAAKNSAEALARFKQLLTDYPDSQFASESVFGVARLAIRNGESDRGVNLLNRLLEKNLDNELERRVRTLYASTSQKQGDHATCLNNLEQVLEGGIVGDARSDALLLAVPSHLAVGHTGMAKQCAQSILEDNPGYPRTDQVLYQLAWMAKREGDAATATRQFGKLVANYTSSPLAPEANFHLGEASFHQDRVREALPYYAEAAKGAVNDELAEKSVHRLAWCYFRNKMYSEAHSVLILQLKKFPVGRTAKVAKFLTAESLFMQRDYGAALPNYEAVADGDGLSAEQEAMVYLHGGQSAGKLGQWKLAERWLIQIHMKFADTKYAPVAYWELSNVFKAQDRFDDAVMSMRRAAKAGKGILSAQSQFELAKLARERGRVGQAYREFQVLMYGYGGNLAQPKVKQLQVLAALEAADCAAENAQNAFRSEEEKYVRQAEKCLQFVLDQSPGTDAAQTATRRMATLVDQFDVEPITR